MQECMTGRVPHGLPYFIPFIWSHLLVTCLSLFPIPRVGGDGDSEVSIIIDNEDYYHWHKQPNRGSCYSRSAKGIWKQLPGGRWRGRKPFSWHHTRTVTMLVLVFLLWSHGSDYPHLSSNEIVNSFQKTKKPRTGWWFRMQTEESLT